MSHATALAKLEDPRHRAEVWQRVLEHDQNITAKLVAAEVERKQAELNKSWFTLAEWMDLDEETRWRALRGWPSDSKFNTTNENIEWAAWSWNPITGCRFGCEYCYARDIANRFYPQGFEPSFHPDRLDAPQNTAVPAPRWDDDRGHKGVFVCSMADLFGNWVPSEWIDAVLHTVREAPQWTFIFLTKNPTRLAGIEFPANSWVGTTVDAQSRVTLAEQAFSQVDARVRFVSCEPLRERLTFSALDRFDWVIVGGQSKSSKAEAFQPPWEWAEHLLWQARQVSKMKVYFKPNLTARPREYP